MKGRCRFLPLVAPALVIFIPCCGNKEKARAEKLFEEARKVLESGKGTEKDRLQKAAYLLKAALRSYPELDEARLLYSKVLFYQCNYSRALEEAKELSDTNPEKPVAIALAAASLYELKGDTALADEAVGNLEFAGSRATVEQRYHVAKCLITGKDEKRQALGLGMMEKIFEEVKNPPSRWEAFFGVALIKAGRKEEGKKHLLKALEDHDLPNYETLKKLVESIK